LISGSAFSQTLPKKQQLITGEDLVIQEDENEHFDDDHLISDDEDYDDSMISYQKTPTHDGGGAPKNPQPPTAPPASATPKLVQSVHQAPVGPPQGLNHLTRTVGKVKRFSSRDYRQGQKQDERP
jgi:hypothetical protein